jgi:hypothetical protein
MKFERDEMLKIKPKFYEPKTKIDEITYCLFSSIFVNFGEI